MRKEDAVVICYMISAAAMSTMKVEISKDQRELLGAKVSLCLNFLKEQIQPHLVSKDRIVIPMGEVLDLCITKEECFVIRTRVISLGIDVFLRTKLYLDKANRKKAKKYICDACPELAVEFLKYWNDAKRELMEQVNEKNKQIADFHSFVNGFQL